MGLVHSTAARAADFVYVVQPGDHLWNIAQRYLLHPAQAQDLLQRNQIPNERRLMPGTRLRIPQEWLRLQTTHVRLAALAGEVSVQIGEAAIRPAVAGESLGALTILRTGNSGSASLVFADGSQVLVLRDSELKLRAAATRTIDQAGMVTLELVRGGLENDVRPRQPQGGRFQIHTPAAIAAVRGTRFRVHVDGDAAPQARTEVLTGAVQVFNPGGQVTATAAQGSVARLHEAPRAPVPLLSPPDLSAMPSQVERLPIDLAFAPLDGASAYRVQITPAPAFDVAVRDVITQTPSLRLLDLQNGRYMVRARGIDPQGLEGLAAQRPLALQVGPEPPLLIEPAAGSTTSDARPQFRWTESVAGTRYRLQISGPGPADPLIPFLPLLEQTVSEGQAVPDEDLAPGAYRWRVASVRDPLPPGPFSDAVPFRRVLAGPETLIATPAGQRLDLRWSAQPSAVRYRLQVARDADFSAPETDVLTLAPQHALQDLEPGLHHVRVQAIDASGAEGAWGGTQTFSAPEPQASPWRLLWLLLPWVLL